MKKLSKEIWSKKRRIIPTIILAQFIRAYLNLQSASDWRKLCPCKSGKLWTSLFCDDVLIVNSWVLP